MRGAFVISVCTFLLVLSSCKQSKLDETYKGPYFNLKTFFEKEALRLRKLDVQVDKTVSKNEQTESKRTKISNWKAELSLFAASDINKPAWKDSYRTISAGNKIQYVSKSADMRPQKISIIKSNNGDIAHISILNQTNNTLYTSTEQLDYYPDSLYRIVKKQKVFIIGTNNYSITGLLIK